MQGDHTPVVSIGLRYGMILFIASEVMFFVAWFWIFFEMALFHHHRTLSAIEEVRTAWATWPPPASRPSRPGTCRWSTP
jgi:cytochrome c oxidase subunit 3